MTQTQTTITAGFEITGWDEASYLEPPEGPKMTRATVLKRFTGALEGTSSTELLTTQGDAGSGYLANERVEGALEGRTGTFVMQHGAAGASERGPSYRFGHVVPGSGTGALTGLTGEVTYAHDERGARITLTYRV